LQPAASTASAANAPLASPSLSAAALTSANSSSVSENCTTRGRDTACRDGRRTAPSDTSITPLARLPPVVGPRPVLRPLTAGSVRQGMRVRLGRLHCLSPDRARSEDKQWLRISCFRHIQHFRKTSATLCDIVGLPKAQHSY